MEDSLRALCSRGARMVRLDAYGYVTKKPGTRCFMEARAPPTPCLPKNLTLSQTQDWRLRAQGARHALLVAAVRRFDAASARGSWGG